MTKQRSNKSSLLLSALALLMCISMFVGSTFAWFTDSVVSGSNVIKSGNLDIEVQYTLDGKTWNDFAGATDLFQKGLWEPGHTEVVALRIKNNGSLALKYVANMNIVEEKVGKTKDGADIVLSDILNVSTLAFEDAGVDPMLGWDIAAMTIEKAFEDENGVAWNAASSFKTSNVLESDQQLLVGATQYVLVKVDMPETVGNEANHDGTNVPMITFGMNILATQYTYESDSFDNQYDKDSEYSGELNKNGSVYSLTGNVTANNESFFADYNSTSDYTVNGNGYTVNGVATRVPDWINGGAIPENGIVFGSGNGAKATVNNITFTGASQMIMSGYYNPSNSKFNTEFNNVKIVDIEATGSVNNEYFAMSVYGNAVMNDCTVKGTTISDLCEDSDEVYDIAVVNGAKLIANNSSFGSIYTGKYPDSSNAWSKAYVELNNSTADIIYACGRTGNGATVINSGSVVETVIANNKTGISLTVAEGATVNCLDLTYITGAVTKSTFNIQGTVNQIIDGENVYETIDQWMIAHAQ